MLDMPGKGEDNFIDVSEEKYYYREIGLAKELGIAQGYKDRFNPEESISRQDAAVIVERALKLLAKIQGEGNEEVLMTFRDKDKVSDYAKASLAT